MKKGIMITVGIILIAAIGIYLNKSSNSSSKGIDIHSHDGGDLHHH